MLPVPWPEASGVWAEWTDDGWASLMSAAFDPRGRLLCRSWGPDLSIGARGRRWWTRKTSRCCSDAKDLTAWIFFWEVPGKGRTKHMSLWVMQVQGRRKQWNCCVFVFGCQTEMKFLIQREFKGLLADRAFHIWKEERHCSEGFRWISFRYIIWYWTGWQQLNYGALRNIPETEALSAPLTHQLSLNIFVVRSRSTFFRCQACVLPFTTANSFECEIIWQRSFYLTLNE